MKSVRTIIGIAVLSIVFISKSGRAQDGEGATPKLTKTILHLDSMFWQAYNTCDIEKMGTFFTDDLEFYHDKGGLTKTKASLMEMTKGGMCSGGDWKLRREVVEGSTHVYKLNNYGAILTGEHVFYILEKGKKEKLDGIAKFTHVWRFENNEWKMARVLSYDHQPAPYRNTRKEIAVSAAVLKKYAGKYNSKEAGVVTVEVAPNSLLLQGNNFKATLYAETENVFFLKERDLQFEFVKDNKNNAIKMIVHENGAVVEENNRVQ